MNNIRKIEARMQQATLYLPVATNLALYCQSSEGLQLTNIVGASRLPQPLPSLGSPFAEESEDEWIEEALRRDKEMDENPDMVMSEEEFWGSLEEFRRQ